LLQEENGILYPENSGETVLCVFETDLVARAIEDGYINGIILISNTGASTQIISSK
jgi:hypothetical protein